MNKPKKFRINTHATHKESTSSKTPETSIFVLTVQIATCPIFSATDLSVRYRGEPQVQQFENSLFNVFKKVCGELKWE